MGRNYPWKFTYKIFPHPTGMGCYQVPRGYMDRAFLPDIALFSASGRAMRISIPFWGSYFFFGGGGGGGGGVNFEGKGGGGGGVILEKFSIETGGGGGTGGQGAWGIARGGGGGTGFFVWPKVTADNNKQPINKLARISFIIVIFIMMRQIKHSIIITKKPCNYRVFFSWFG